MVSHVVIVLAMCSAAVASPIIRIKNVNGQKKSYCCYGVVQPFDMNAKAKQGLRALNQVGFDLKKLRKVVDIHQKAVEGKLENVEKEAEGLNKRVQEALKATMKILSDATKKASKTLSEVTEASNDLGKLGKDITGTKTHDMITKIREMIAEKPHKKKSNHKKAEDAKHADKIARPNNKKSNNKTSDDDKTAKPVKPKETKKDDHTKSRKKHNALHPKDRIPGRNKVEERVVAQRILENAEMYENEQVKRARDFVEKKTEDNKRAIENAKDFLRRVQDGLLQVQNGIKEAGFELN